MRFSVESVDTSRSPSTATARQALRRSPTSSRVREPTTAPLLLPDAVIFPSVQGLDVRPTNLTARYGMDSLQMHFDIQPKCHANAIFWTTSDHSVGLHHPASQPKPGHREQHLSVAAPYAASPNWGKAAIRQVTLSGPKRPSSAVCPENLMRLGRRPTGAVVTRRSFHASPNAGQNCTSGVTRSEQRGLLR